MPLPRLQIMGLVERPFIYQIHWDTGIQRRDVASYLAGRGGFDNRILLRPGVGEYFLQLNGLLRPLIQRRWAAMVAQLNGLEESQLDVFLFGADRVSTAKVRAGLWELQDRRCFYCDLRHQASRRRRTSITSSRGRATPTTASTTSSSPTGAAMATRAVRWRPSSTLRAGLSE